MKEFHQQMTYKQKLMKKDFFFWYLNSYIHLNLLLCSKGCWITTTTTTKIFFVCFWYFWIVEKKNFPKKNQCLVHMLKAKMCNMMMTNFRKRKRRKKTDKIPYPLMWRFTMLTSKNENWMKRNEMEWNGMMIIYI